MKHFFRHILWVIMCITYLSASSVNTDVPNYGIRITSYPAPSSDFTSILLDNGNPIATNGDDVILEMDVWTYPENPLGSICRIITDSGCNVDLLYGVHNDVTGYPVFVTGDKDVMIKSPLVYSKWIHAAIKVSPATGKITFTYGDDTRTIDYPEFKGTKSLRIAVGLCPISDFLLFDVASVAVKDVTITRNGKEIRYWKMQRHDSDVCYDEIAHQPATVKNANWIIDEIATWQPIYTGKFPFFPSVAFDPTVATFYLAYKDEKSLFVFHAEENTTDTIQTTGGYYAANYPNQMIYIKPMNTLLSYNINEDLFAPFIPATQVWCNNTPATKEHDYWNNTTTYYAPDSALISFGGYGHHHYKNVIIRSYPFNNRPQTIDTIRGIDPRYSSSSAIVDSTLYIFGGRGCPSGRQELAPRNYYDLYAVNLRTNHAEKLWGGTTSPMPTEFVPGENMIYEKDTNSFLVWTTMDGGTLLRIGIDTGEFERMSLPMEGWTESQTLYTNLYYSPAQKSLYSVIVTSDVNGRSDASIYRLKYPPISISQLTQIGDLSVESTGSNHYIWLIIAGVLGVAGVAAYFMWRRKQQPVNTESHPAAPETPQDEAKATDTEAAKQEANAEEKAHIKIQAEPTAEPHYNLSQGAVRFFGGFRVYDKDGKDITPLFTPTLKQLLILLILYTAENPMGIPNNKLLTLLWSDKEEDAAKNNRNVYMSRLRNLLTQVGNVTIQTHNGFRNINFGPGTVCDYIEAIRLFDNTDSENLDKLLELLFNGMMLPNVELDYVDSFKSNFSNKTLDLLSSLLQQDDIPDNLKMKITDTLFLHDFINEEALFAKCRLLHKQGRTGVAKTVYSSFCKEYRALMGSDYPHSLVDIIGIPT